MFKVIVKPNMILIMHNSNGHLMKTLYNATRNEAIVVPVFGDFRVNSTSSKYYFL
jgi:hypothetical protein